MSVFVVAGCSSVPLMYNKRNKERLDTLTEFSELIKEVSHEVRYLLTPIPEALKNAKRHRSASVAKTVDDFLYGLSKSSSVKANIDKIWTGAIYYNKTELKISDEECKVLCQFGDYIASSNYSIKAMDSSMLLVVERIDKVVEEARVKHEKYAPMYNKLGLLGGLALSLFTI